MIQSVIEVIFHSGLQALGWAVLKVMTFSRYRGFQPEDILFEGTLGFATVALAGYGVYWLVF